MSQQADLLNRRMRAAELCSRGEFAEAIDVLQQAIASQPETIAARLDIAEAWRESGDLGRAMAYQEEAIALAPQNKTAHERLGMLRLYCGDFSRASWEHYLWHWALEVERASGVAAPAWDGSDLAGKHIVLIAHQGLGDQILFASCVPDVRARATTIFCERRLVKLFCRSFAGAEVLDVSALATTARELRADFQAALGRLPVYLRNQWSDFSGRAFLSADAARVASWRQRLQQLGPGLKVGLSWRGGNPEKAGKRRSVPLAQWGAVLAVPRVHFVSLQYGDYRAELEQASATFGVGVHHWQEAIDDYDETAALAGALDLVISVTTAVVHLAAALGTPTWVLVNAKPQWRYLERGARMPWYAAVKLFRQRPPSDWRDVLHEIARELVSLSARTG